MAENTLDCLHHAPRSLYVTLSPTGGARGDPQAHRAAGSTGRCYDMTPGESRGVNYKIGAAGAAGDGGGGTSPGLASPLLSDRGGERGQPKLAPPGARASRLTLSGAARSRAADTAPAASAGPASHSFPAASGRAQLLLPWDPACPPVGPGCEAPPQERACPLARAEACMGMKPFRLGSGSGCPWLLLGSAVSQAAWAC